MKRRRVKEVVNTSHLMDTLITRRCEGYSLVRQRFVPSRTNQRRNRFLRRFYFNFCPSPLLLVFPEEEYLAGG